MPFFGADGVVSNTQRVDLDGKYYVMVGLLSGAQEQECNAVLNGGKTAKSRVTARSGGKTQDAEQVTELTIDYAAYVDARLLRGIREWNLDEADGTVAPIDLAHIRGLPQLYRNQIFEELDTFNAPLAKRKEAASETPLITSSRTGAEG
jgi:hypothetical protein